MEPPQSRLASGWIQFRQPSLSPQLLPVMLSGPPVERVLRKLVKHLELAELGSMSSSCGWRAMIRHFHPDLNDTQLIQALMRRSPERES